MPTVNQLPWRAQYFDIQAGLLVPATAYFLDTFISGTTTAQATYSDAAGTILNTNPVVLNAEGKADVFLAAGQVYTLRLRRTAALGGGVVQTLNDVSGIALPTSGSFLPLAGGTMTGALTLAGNATTNLQAVTRQQLNTAISSVTQAVLTAVGTPVPVGSITIWPLSVPPAGYVEANGAALSRTTFAALFSIYATTFGVGDGSTTFNVPDLRGEFVRGWDNARGVDSGRGIATAQAGDNLAHTHQFANQFFKGKADGNAPVTNEGVLFSLAGPTVYAPTMSTVGASEARPRNVAMMYIIKV
jgi:microcystin-dependent protein